MEKVHEEAGSHGRVRYDKGDVEFAVVWYHRDISGGHERRIFKRWEANAQAKDPGPELGRTYTFNSTELRMIDVEMRPRPPIGGAPLNVVQREARPARAAAQQGIDRRRQNATGIVYQVQEQRAELRTQLWEVSEGSEGRILLHCH